MPLFSFSTHKQCILSQKHTTALLCFSLKPYTLAGFEPGSAVFEADSMSTAPRRQGSTPISTSVCPDRILTRIFGSLDEAKYECRCHICMFKHVFVYVQIFERHQVEVQIVDIFVKMDISC
jgi:hypothetical protein